MVSQELRCDTQTQRVSLSTYGTSVLRVVMTDAISENFFNFFQLNFVTHVALCLVLKKLFEADVFFKWFFDNFDTKRLNFLALVLR